jgi:hypothetical protein
VQGPPETNIHPLYLTNTKPPQPLHNSPYSTSNNSSPLRLGILFLTPHTSSQPITPISHPRIETWLAGQTDTRLLSRPCDFSSIRYEANLRCMPSLHTDSNMAFAQPGSEGMLFLHSLPMLSTYCDPAVFCLGSQDRRFGRLLHRPPLPIRHYGQRDSH